MGKNDKKIFSIRQVSELTNVPAHTIRFWEKDFGMYLKPERSDGGQRRYCKKDIEIIEKIKYFRYEQRYTISGTIHELQNGKKSASGKSFEKVVDEIAEMIRKRVLEKIRR